MSSTTTSKTATVTITESELSAIVAQAVATALAGTTTTEAPAPAKKAPTKRLTAKQKKAKAKSEAFVKWLGDTAEQRAERKTDNKALAAWCREKGLLPSGAVWAAVKDGESKLSVLRPLDKAHRAELAA